MLLLGVRRAVMVVSQKSCVGMVEMADDEDDGSWVMAMTMAVMLTMGRR
jgi:hypothetical protein